MSTIIQLSPTEWLHLDTMTPITDDPAHAALEVQLPGVTAHGGMTPHAKKTYTGDARRTLLEYLEQYADKRGWPALEGVRDAV
jgi:hypothetical protein